MADQTEVQALKQRERIAVATAAALFVAGIVLVTAVLPAEYGVDPVGTGKAFGLTQIAEAAAAESLTPAALPGANTPQPMGFRRNTMTFKLEPDEGVEYKYRMQKGASMVYAWKATGKVEAEFHGEPQGAPKGYADTYEKVENTAGDGAFFAPSTGIHGWWWKNLTSAPITVTIESAGFYTGAIEFRRTGRTDHDIKERTE
jgi:hypothetical protein